jgi:calcineurin-like phosphoesterase family protein
MDRNIFAISDTHFGHENMLGFTDRQGLPIRQFISIEQHDEYILDMWNQTVRPEDIVYHLGDVFFGRGHLLLRRLNGRKRLLLGNHDNGKNRHLQENFQKIAMWRMFPEFNCVLTHVPILIPEFGKYEYNIHGHIHQNGSPTDHHINVSCEAVKYIPQNIETLMAGK